jgi:cytochrome b
MSHDGMSDTALKPYVRVWDLPTRIFHWSIVLLVCISWLSADRGLMTIHLWSGLTLLTLLLFRIGWGLVGSTTSRFSDFIRPPRQVIGYLRAMRAGQKTLYAGHNPAGGLMVAAMICILLAQALTGLFSNDGLHFTGPLALWISDDASTQITGLHGKIFNIILLLVWCHVVAVGFYLLVGNDNLIRPMLTGLKLRAHVPPGISLRFTRLYVALILLAGVGALVALIAVQAQQ